jgi:hypothetical protein
MKGHLIRERRQEKIRNTISSDTQEEIFCKKLNEEYYGLAYNRGAMSPTNSEETNLSEENREVSFTSQGQGQTLLPKKKSIDGDFRAKYKTEICKFWAFNKQCRYGDNVRKNIFLKIKILFFKKFF